MKIIGYIIVISILLNLLVQFGLILRYYYPLIVEYFKNEKISWNSNYDRVITGAFIVAFSFTFYFTNILLKTKPNNKNTITFNNITIILYILITITFTALVYLCYKKAIEERKKNIDEIDNPEENNDYTEAENTNDSIKSFNDQLNNNQLIYLYNEFKKNDFIISDFNQNDFCSKFLNEKIKLTKKVSSVNLYHIHNHLIENIKVDKNLDLKTFISYFITYKNGEFLYASVKNGSQIKYTEAVETIEVIFINIPK